MDPVAGLDSAGATQAQPWVKPQKTTTYILTVVDTVRSCRGPGRDSVTVAVCSGINEKFKVDNEKLKLYPNPTNGTIQMDYLLEDGEHGYLVIYNILGKADVKYELDPEKRSLKISKDALDAGIYFYEVVIGDIVEIKEKLLIIR